MIRVREVREDGSRSSVCRCMLHTGYVEGASIQLKKEQLDGACNDAR